MLEPSWVRIIGKSHIPHGSDYGGTVIDTPERRQPYGNRAKQTLSDLTFKKPVAVKFVDIDRYQRIVGRIYVDNLDVSAEMVRVGAAWVYRKYAKDQSLYKLEDEAHDLQES